MENMKCELCGDIEDICPQVKVCEACYNNPDNAHEFGNYQHDASIMRDVNDELPF